MNTPSLGCCDTRRQQICCAWSALPIFSSTSISILYLALKANLAFHISRIFCFLSCSLCAFLSVVSTSALESPRCRATSLHDSRERAMSRRCSPVQALSSRTGFTPTSTNSSSRVTPDMFELNLWPAGCGQWSRTVLGSGRNTAI